MTTDPHEPGDALKRLLEGLSEVLEQVHESVKRNHELAEHERAAKEHIEHSGGVAIPMGFDASTVPEAYRPILLALMTEQGRASLFLGQLDAEHPYRQLFHTIAETWDQSAVIGALAIAKHNMEQHGADEINVGPSEFGAAWASIAVSAALGGVRYGQEHPDAFKGLEGLKPGEIDDTVAKLIEWAAIEHGKGGEAAPDQA